MQGGMPACCRGDYRCATGRYRNKEERGGCRQTAPVQLAGDPAAASQNRDCNPCAALSWLLYAALDVIAAFSLAVSSDPPRCTFFLSIATEATAMVCTDSPLPVAECSQHR